jgi:hypothetical protein
MWDGGLVWRVRDVAVKERLWVGGK